MVEASGSKPPAPRQSRHIPALDGLRGIAILLVVLHNAPDFPTHSSGFIWLAAIVGTVGWIGVELFFVLSGFLITRQLLDSQRSGNYYRAFFGRRILRIFPLYYVALLIGLVVFPLVFPGAVDSSSPRRDQIWLWTFLFNWAHPFGTAGFGFSHFWSLAIEEQFYLIWPFVVRKRNPRSLREAVRVDRGDRTGDPDRHARIRREPADGVRVHHLPHGRARDRRRRGRPHADTVRRCARSRRRALVVSRPRPCWP